MIDKELKEKMKQESITRLKMLKLHKNVIYDFKTEDKLNKSEGANAILYWLDDKEQEIVKGLEKIYDVMVYHVIKTYTRDLGEVLDLLYVDEYENCWDEEKDLIKDGYVRSYTVSPFCESGDICIESKNGGLIRKY